MQVLLQRVTDGALAVGPAHVQRDFVHPLDLMGNLGAPQDETDLRAVSVADGHFPTLLDQVGNVEAGLFRGLVLVFDGAVSLVFYQGVAANGYDGEVVGGSGHICLRGKLVDW